jgi:Bacterial Ig-like domain (group 3)/Pentapeptide repeats (8 copies)
MTVQPSPTKKSLHSIMYESSNARWFLPSLFCLGMILWVLRKINPLFMIQPFAEDGTIFLYDAIHAPWTSLLSSHGDYLMFIPHLVALFSFKSLGLSNAPVGMYFTGIVIGTLCAIFFATKQFRFIIKNDLLRALCSMFIVLVPGIAQVYDYSISTVEYFLNIFLMLFTTLLLFRYDEYQSKSTKKKYLYTFFCSMSFLTSAYSVVFLPALVYVAIRQFRKNKKETITILSYAIPVIPLLFQIVTLYIDHFQNYSAQTNHVNGENTSSFLFLFAGGISKIFYSNTANLAHYSEWAVYFIGAAVVVFILLNSLKNGLKLELYILACIGAVLFLTAIVRGAQYIYNSPAVLGGYERYFFFATVFSFILIVRQFDKRRSLLFGFIFLAMMSVVVFNITSAFSIPPFPDVNYENMAKAYDQTGQYSCLINVSPYPYHFDVPCLKPTSINETTTIVTSGSPDAISGTMTTFTATVFPIPNAGTVQFHIDGMAVGNPVSVVGGQAVLSTPALPIGIHKIFASYSGDPAFYSSNSNMTSVTILSISNLRGANLSGADLKNINLSGANLYAANLSEANLNYANLSTANLQDSNLSEASLLGADLKEGNLQGSNLQGVNLQNADLTGANLQNVNLSGAILRDANITDANFTGALTNGCNGCHN